MSFDWLFNDGGIIVVLIAAVPAWFILRHLLLEARARRAKLERDMYVHGAIEQWKKDMDIHDGR